MSARDWLDADLGAVVQRGREFLRWWGGELADMVRPLLGSQTAGRIKLIAERGRDGVYRLSRDGVPVGEHFPHDRPVRAALALPSDAALVRRLTRPALSDRDLVRMTVLDIDRLTPFAEAEVYYDVTVLPGEDDAREVRLAVVPRPVADAVLELAQAEGVQPSALLAIQPEARIDFLPAVKRSQTQAAAPAGLEIAWLAVAALVAANVGLAIWRDVRATDALQTSVAAQAPVAERVQLARRQTVRLQDAAAEQAAARSRGEPLRILNAASTALPAGAWVQRLSWDGQTLRIAGQAKAGVDSLAALRRVAMFADARASDPAAQPGDTGFDITAHVAAAAQMRGRP